MIKSTRTPDFEENDFDFESRIISSRELTEDGDSEVTLRPKTLAEYIGQGRVKEKLAISMEAAKMRGECLDHILLHGPPGLGKTTLSAIIASEMGAGIRITSGPAIEKQGDLAALLTNLKENDILFIDEIHRLPVRWKKSYIPPWRISIWISSWVKVLQHGASGCRCPILP